MTIHLPYIQTLLDDSAIAHIMINGWQQVFIEKEAGGMDNIPTPFHNEDELMALIHAIAGVKLSEAQPIVSFRLSDGVLVDIALPPVSVLGPAVTIRKPAARELTLENLIEYKTLTPKAADFLRVCVEARVNIVVSGGASSGKITLTKIIAGWIPRDERILLLLDNGKPGLAHPHLLVLETRPPNQEGKGEVTMRQLVQCALRMRPDRIIVTELCGAETTEILDGINHGYDGAILCMQSNGPRDTLARLERMDALGNPEVPLLQLREQIASSIDLIVHQERLRDGSRRIVNICEVTGMDQGVVTLSDIFYFSQTGFENGLVQASLMTTGLIPRFMKKLDEMGRGLPLSFFTTGEV